jgi:hypothetical protein
MSLDVSLMVVKPCEVYTANITHNLGAMASEVKLSNGLTLYDVLWRPDEHSLVYARDIADLLDEGWNILLCDPDHFMTFDPPNKWGSYDGLQNFVYKYRNACWDNPDSTLSISR